MASFKMDYDISWILTAVDYLLHYIFSIHQMQFGLKDAWVLPDNWIYIEVQVIVSVNIELIGELK